MLLRTLTSERKAKPDSPIESPDFSKYKYGESAWAKLQTQRSLSPKCCSPAEFYESVMKALQEFLRKTDPSNPSEGSKPGEVGEVGEGVKGGEGGEVGEASDHKSE